jgi:Holliday junction resolvase RusA-like endonuclease
VIKISLSETPPTVNTMYRNLRGRGRVKTARYLKWCDFAEFEIKRQYPKKITSNTYGLILMINKRSNGDLSNYIKPIEDLLVRMGITPDDQFNVLPIAMPKIDAKGVDIIILDKNDTKLLSQEILSFIE